MNNNTRPKSSIPIYLALSLFSIWLVISTGVGYFAMGSAAALGSRQLDTVSQVLYCLAPAFVFLSMLVLAWYFTEKTSSRGFVLFLLIVLSSLFIQWVCYSIGFQLSIMSYQYAGEMENEIYEAFGTATALERTLNPPTITPTATPDLAMAELEAALELAGNKTGSNGDWQAAYPDGFVREFDGVPMVLVPSGCFRMGNDEGAISPMGQIDDGGVPDGGRQCFDEPFWIDQTEVTQGQPVDLNYDAVLSPIVGENLPLHGISWFDARHYCVFRGGRLPSEAEWEYAARGPDAWIYPWGNEWDEDNVVWNRDYFRDGPLEVGSIPEGRSWVGAMDMAGNVWEWTRSHNAAYPYDRDDGREIDAPEYDDSLEFMVRGSSWVAMIPEQIRVSNRDYVRVISFGHNFTGGDSGFRCMREVD